MVQDSAFRGLFVLTNFVKRLFSSPKSPSFRPREWEIPDKSKKTNYFRTVRGRLYKNFKRLVIQYRVQELKSDVISSLERPLAVKSDILPKPTIQQRS